MISRYTILLAILVIQFSPSLAQYSSVFRSSVDPCHPTPCGPNTQCSVNSARAAICRCLPGFFPKPDTITGCGLQCTHDTDCRTQERCASGKCVSVCQTSRCGINAECEALNHREVCKCPRGFIGDPLSQCTQSSPIARRIISQPAPLLISRAPDPCAGSPCGFNAECSSNGARPVCRCPPGHQGDPYRGCRRGECEANNECPSFKVCQNYQCISPCLTACGLNAECDVRNHVAICRCPAGWTGNAHISCRIYDENELCNPTPCGINTKCRVDSGRAICSCESTYTGNPLTGCRHECESNRECGSGTACIEFKCKDPCLNACGDHATCEVVNHLAACRCPPDYLGDPYTRCFAECIRHSDCPANRACIGLKCGDPCATACGLNAECRVDRSSHKAICSCPKGYTGHPFESCRRQTPEDLCHPNPCGTNAQCQPGHDNTGRDRPVCTCLPGYVGDALHHCNRGECLSDSDCGPTRTCRNFECRNPCDGACGVNADCEQRNHGAVCQCPRGFTGDPFHQCTAEPFRGRRHLSLTKKDEAGLEIPVETPEAEKAPETPEVPETPKDPDTPDTSETPKDPDTPETSEAPKDPDTPETSEAPKDPEITETLKVLEAQEENKE